ncbi:MAG: SLC13 family permease [Opitutae bacterium]|nr:SLC13 family permease [Opitutae bacterium]|tara:strand:+ start:5541 stop:7400 length:1860 start_codon:yes stop_codon:yes gene_type:complete
MTWEIAFTFALLGFALLSFIKEKLSTDVTAITVFAVIVAVSTISHEMTQGVALPEIEEILGVFSNPAPVTIAAMFVVSAALSKCHIIEGISSYLGRLGKLPYPSFMLFLILSVAFISAFVNNTPVVVVFLPVVLVLSKQMGVSSSKLLIPMSYASIFGGCCTLVGTSTNILASGVLASTRDASTGELMQPLGMFELAKYGLPLLAVGTIYLILFGRRLLPDREALSTILSDIQQKEFITEALVRRNSALVGKTASESRLQKFKGLRILEIIRKGTTLMGPKDQITLNAGDRIVLSCRPSAIAAARNVEGLDIVGEGELGLEQVSSTAGVMVEGVIGPSSPLAALSLREINFRKRYNVTVMAIHRKGRNVTSELENIRLHQTDTLLLLGSEEAINNLRNSEDLILLDRPPVPVDDMRRKAPIVLGVIAGIVILASLTPMPIVASAVIGVAVLFLTNCIKPKEGYQAVEWSILVLIYGMLALGLAMKESGASDLIAHGLANGMLSYAPKELEPLLLLIAIYLTTSLLTETLSNTATIALMAPIAIEMAFQLQYDPRPFLIATCIAASASFTTPIGYQTNTYVYSVGGYRFRDFVKVGLPLNLLYFSMSIIMISHWAGFWPA